MYQTVKRSVGHSSTSRICRFYYVTDQCRLELGGKPISHRVLDSSPTHFRFLHPKTYSCKESALVFLPNHLALRVAMVLAILRLSSSDLELGTLSHDARSAFCILTVYPTNISLSRCPVGTNPQRRSHIGRLIELSPNQIRTPCRIACAIFQGTSLLQSSFTLPRMNAPQSQHHDHQIADKPSSNLPTALYHRLWRISASGASPRLLTCFD
jgi:hypothetical protein